MEVRDEVEEGKAMSASVAPTGVTVDDTGSAVEDVSVWTGEGTGVGRVDVVKGRGMGVGTGEAGVGGVEDFDVASVGSESVRSRTLEVVGVATSAGASCLTTSAYEMGRFVPSGASPPPGVALPEAVLDLIEVGRECDLEALGVDLLSEGRVSGPAVDAQHLRDEKQDSLSTAALLCCLEGTVASRFISDVGLFDASQQTFAFSALRGRSSLGRPPSDSRDELSPRARDGPER